MRYTETEYFLILKAADEPKDAINRNKSGITLRFFSSEQPDRMARSNRIIDICGKTDIMEQNGIERKKIKKEAGSDKEKCSSVTFTPPGPKFRPCCSGAARHKFGPTGYEFHQTEKKNRKIKRKITGILFLEGGFRL